MGFGAVATSCDSDTFGDQVVEYGVPVVHYRISARVVDDSGNPIKCIEAKALYDLNQHDYFYALGYSSEEGVISSEQMTMELPLYLQLRDVDGEENGGEFDSLSVDISEKFVKVSEGEGWHTGTYEAELGDVVMTLEDDAILNE